MAQTKHHGLHRVGWMFALQGRGLQLNQTAKTAADRMRRPEYPQGQISSLGDVQNARNLSTNQEFFGCANKKSREPRVFQRPVKAPTNSPAMP